MSDPIIITTEEEYDAANALLPTLWDAKPGTQEWGDLDALVAAIEAYDDEHYPIEPPGSLAALQFRIEQWYPWTSPFWLWLEGGIEKVMAWLERRLS